MNHCWQPVALREVVAPASRPHAVLATGEYPLIGVRLEGFGPFLRETRLGSEIRANTLYEVREGDFVYSRLFAWRGAFGVIGTALDGCFTSGEFPVFTAAPGKLDVRFLELWFRLPQIRAMVLAECTGSTPVTRNRFKEDRFLRMAIPLPPLPEQRRIVAKIDAIAAGINEAKGLRAEAIKNMTSFVSTLHLRLSSQNAVRLGDVLELDEHQETVVPGRTYPQVGMKSFGLGLFPKPPIPAEETTYRRFNRLFEGAVVLSQVKGWEGAVAVCPAELAGYYASPEYRTFRCREGEAVPAYFAGLVATPWFHFHLSQATRGVGARRERVRPERFLELRLPMPNADRQTWAAGVLDRTRALMPLQEQTSTDLDALMPSVLDRAFRGEL